MDDDVWAVSRRGKRFVLTLPSAAPRPLVASLTAAEMARAEPVLPEVAETVRRGEFSRVQLGAAFQAAIGRDPFRQAKPRQPLQPWIGLCQIVVGLGFATGSASPWLRPAGYVVAAIGLVEIVSQVWRRFRA